MSSPTVSVIIPTYNRPEKLLRAVNSVLEQTYQDIEIIVINDFPEQDVSEVLPDYESVRCIQHKQNRGAPVARNNGIQSSNGEFIALLDDDDAWKPQKLEKQIEYIKSASSSVGLVYAGREIIYSDGKKDVEISNNDGWVHQELLKKNFIPSETPIIRAECFDCVGLFDPDLPSCQDYDLWLRIAKEYKVGVLEQPLAIAFRDHEDRISNNMNKKYTGHRMLIKKHNDDFKMNPSALSKHHRQIGIFAMRSNRVSEAQSYLLSVFTSNPSDVILLFYMVLNYAPASVQEKFFSLKESLYQ
ncbi:MULTISPECIES: glycosyltransferase family 2 protein [unclassified Haloferax]|uniref:glycosyltransferase family 2 protein n=1 Tax=unclassified Haloferax TaxID=2625095 RepID=UPI0002AF7113|nr:MULTISPECIES: glycosyltransferase family 2 protein [unclassified Haloferax]ELZ56307.1 glycosyl transferase [Haloferax sp. ATCC BAA-646]ELZ67651.1 glycosyl transferase [Haloferax sp. ATCC BAA-645]ELZ68222.1 glycosyl transferase [Haloferax sp. ATCC BAA-644]